jgi:hypothetical protein
VTSGKWVATGFVEGLEKWEVCMGFNILNFKAYIFKSCSLHVYMSPGA